MSQPKITAGSGRHFAMTACWWISVPYSVLFTGLVKWLQPSPHIFYQLIFLYWVLVALSTAWTIVSILMFLTRAILWTPGNMVMIGLGVAVCAFAGPEVFFALTH